MAIYLILSKKGTLKTYILVESLFEKKYVQNVVYLGYFFHLEQFIVISWENHRSNGFTNMVMAVKNRYVSKYKNLRRFRQLLFQYPRPSPSGYNTGQLSAK